MASWLASADSAQIGPAGKRRPSRGTALPPTVLVLALILSTNAGAQLGDSERQQIQRIFMGKLYLRVDAPCDYRRMVPMLEVSPTETNATAKVGEITEKDKPNLYWRFGPNDAIHRGTVRWGVNGFRVWAEGVPPKRDEVMVDFVQIKTMDDFKKALDLAFSPVPLHEAHPQWPPEIRKAIMERRLIEGMTKEQASCVIGTPASTQVAAAAGGEVEVWSPRQENGLRPMFGNPNLRTGFPASLKFIDGKLADIERPPVPGPGAGKK